MQSASFACESSNHPSYHELKDESQKKSYIAMAMASYLVQ